MAGVRGPERQVAGRARVVDAAEGAAVAGGEVDRNVAGAAAARDRDEDVAVLLVGAEGRGPELHGAALPGPAAVRAGQRGEDVRRPAGVARVQVARRAVED